MKRDAELSILLEALRSRIGHDLVVSSAARSRYPLTADWYKHAVQDSADESVRDEMDAREQETYELLKKLEEKGWDGRTGRQRD